MQRSFVSLIFCLLTMTLPAGAVVNGYGIEPLQRPEVGFLVAYDQKISENGEENLPIPERCTGVFISDYQMLTAGHCVRDAKGEKNLYLFKWDKNGRGYVVSPLRVTTNYIYEELIDPPTTGPVPGCSPGLKPIPKTQTEDIALIEFPRNTTTKWFPLNLNYQPQEKMWMEYYGFGITQNPYASQVLSNRPSDKDLHVGSSALWRWSEQRIVMLAPDTRSFAAPGDSGGPVLADGHVVAIMSTVGTKCDTEFGEDYAIQNSATRLSAEKLRALGLDY